MNEQETLWLKKARSGDREAFGKLVEAFQGPVYNLIYRMLDNPEEAEDAVQVTFLRAYSRLHQYDPAHKFSTWLFAIANNHCIDRLRKRRVTKISMDESPVAYTLASENPGPDEQILTQERSRELQSMLNRLDPAYRTPLILRYWHDYSYKEIATTMDLSLAAVKSRLFRARQQLADIYEEAEREAQASSARQREQQSPNSNASSSARLPSSRSLQLTPGGVS